MKKNTPAFLSAICAVLGLLCLIARYWYLSTAMDQKGLLISHTGNAISWILTAAAVGVCLLLVLTTQPRITFENTPLNHVGAVACILALGFVAGQLLTASTLLDIAAGVLALIAALCVVMQIMCRLSGAPVPALSRFPLILFYLFFLLNSYRHWSTQPQTALYVFQLLALVTLTLTAYQRAALALHTGNDRMYLISANLAIFFSLAAVPGSSSWIFFLFMAAAVLLDICREKARQEA